MLKNDFIWFFADLTDSMVELGPHAYKIVRQCLRQLDLLKNVWQTILPELVYNKSLGTILNDLCDEIIRKVVSREDISSAVANGLVNICDVIMERAPALFAVRLILTIWITIHSKRYSAEFVTKRFNVEYIQIKNFILRTFLFLCTCRILWRCRFM